MKGAERLNQVLEFACSTAACIQSFEQVPSKLKSRNDITNRTESYRHFVFIREIS